MSKKRLDEASVTAMIHGFLAGKKKAVQEKKNKAVGQKKEAFWNSIVESVILEVGEDPDDYRQSLEFDRPGFEGLRSNDFSLSDQGIGGVDVPLVPMENPGERERESSKLRNVAMIQKLIRKKLREIKKYNPVEWKRYENLSEPEKRLYKIKLWQDNKDNINSFIQNQSSRVTRAMGDDFRKQIVRSVVSQVLNRLVEATRNGEEIPPDLSFFSSRFLGFKPTDRAEKSLLAKLAKENKIPEEVINNISKKVLDNKTEQDFLKFINTHLDVYPGDFTDEIERKANLANVPNSKMGGIGRGVQRVYTQPVGTFIDPGQKHLADADEEIKNAIVSRSGTGNSKLYRLINNLDIDNLLKFARYYHQNPEEIVRATKERIGPAPQSLADIVGNIGPAPDRNATLKGEKNRTHSAYPSEIGSEFASSILTKPEREKAIAAWQKKTKKAPFIQGAGVKADFEQSLNLDPRDVLARLSDFGTDDDLSYPNPGTMQGKVAERAARALNAAFKKDINKKITPEDVADVMAKLIIRNKRGQYDGLRDPKEVPWDSGDEALIGHALYQYFDPIRMKKDILKNKEGLHSVISDFAANEEEKVAANIPALKRALDYDKQMSAMVKSAKGKKGFRKLSLADMLSVGEEERQRKDKLARSILNRLSELQASKKEKEAAMAVLKMIQDKKREEEEAAKAAAAAEAETAAAAEAETAQTDTPRAPEPTPKQMEIGLAVLRRLGVIKEPKKKKERKEKRPDVEDLVHVYAGPREKAQYPGFEDPSQHNPPSPVRHLVDELIKDASSKLRTAGEKVTPNRLIQHIATNFTRGPGGSSRYPERYDVVRDFFLRRARELKEKTALDEGINYRSILEFLADIGTNENKHVEPKKKEGWDKAPLVKKVNMVPKWKKGKMKIADVFIGNEDDE